MVKSKHEAENCHWQLIERLDKTEHKLVLRIIDAQNMIKEQSSGNNCLYDFRRAWELANELNFYTEERLELEIFSDSRRSCTLRKR